MGNGRLRARLVMAVTVGLVLATTAVPASGDDGSDHSENLRLTANSARTTSVSQSDLAFWEGVAYAGNYEGFRVLDISSPGNVTQIADIRCTGAQGDVSVWDGLLFVSVDRPTTSLGCEGRNTQTGVNGFEGIRVFDVSDPSAPRFVTGVPTDCGSHTHTLVPDVANDRVLLYVSSYPLTFLGPTPYGTSCDLVKPDGTQGHSKISIVAVPLAAPAEAAVVAEPRFELSNFAGVPGLRGCHDIQVFLELQVAAAACLSEGQLWDISDPLRPVTTQRIFNPEVNIWHSAAFTYDGSVVIFGDEFAGGSGPGCANPDDPLGRVYFYDRSDPATPLGTYKIPRAQDTNACTMHNFNVVPTIRGYTLVAASNEGGTTVVDFSDPAAPREVAFFDAQDGSPWSSYWYNGRIYVNDRRRGVDVLSLSDPARAGARSLTHLNPQTQESLIP